MTWNPRTPVRAWTEKNIKVRVARLANRVREVRCIESPAPGRAGQGSIRLSLAIRVGYRSIVLATRTLI
jgi:hypothetical protein